MNVNYINWTSIAKIAIDDPMCCGFKLVKDLGAYQGSMFYVYFPSKSSLVDFLLKVKKHWPSKEFKYENLDEENEWYTAIIPVVSDLAKQNRKPPYETLY